MLPLLLVHGSNLDSRSFDWMAGPLAKTHRTVVMDLRFRGRSRDAGGPVSWEGDLLEVTDAAHVERATLLGHSLGAQIVVDFALAHPERVERLTVPVLVLVGDSDLTEASKVADLVAARARRARVATLDRCGHLAPIDCPDQVLRAVEAFLR